MLQPAVPSTFTTASLSADNITSPAISGSGSPIYLDIPVVEVSSNIGNIEMLTEERSECTFSRTPSLPSRKRFKQACSTESKIEEYQSQMMSAMGEMKKELENVNCHFIYLNKTLSSIDESLKILANRK